MSSETNNQEKEEKLKRGCLFIIAMPFLVVGLFALVNALKELLSGNTDFENIMTMFVPAVISSLIGGGIIYAIVHYQRSQERQRLIRSRNPGKPWLWQEDWASGKIKSAEKKSVFVMLFFVIFWNAISWTALIAFLSEGIKDNAVPFILVSLFPVIGFFLLVSAIRELLRLKKYGVSTFEMTTIPGIIGDRLEGTVYARLSETPPKGMTIILKCVNRITTGSGKSRSTREHVLWQEQKIIDRAYISRGYKASAIPVSLSIPIDVEETNTSNSNNMIIWRLEANAETPGIDYKALFDIPVFRTEKTLSLEKESQTANIEVTEDELSSYQAPAATSITIKSTQTGGTEFYFPPMRNLACATTLITIFFIGVGIVYVVIRNSGALIVPLIFSAMGLVIFVATLNKVAGSSKVTIEGGNVIIRNALLGLGSRKTVPCSDVLDVTISRGMSSSNKVYYDIALVTHSGRRIPAASMINDRKYALWLAGQMKYYIHQWR